MMFQRHRIQTNTISLRNLVFLFFTIVFGFASVITLADIEITSDISNARQTIARITLTSDGTDGGTKNMDISSGGIYINSGILDNQQTFSGKVLGLSPQGNLISVASQNLVVSGAGGGDNGAWTITGNNVYKYTGNVGIGTNAPTNKLHIVNSGSTDVYIEEQASGMAANLNLKNPIRTRALGSDSSPDVFYIGPAGGLLYFVITPTGFVGIGTHTPKANLQVSGNIMGGGENNSITGTNTTIAGGNGNSISGDFSFIGGGAGNTLVGDNSVIVMGIKANSITNANNSFIGAGNANKILGGEYSNIVGGQGNTISGASYSAIAGGVSNEVYGNSSTIGGGNANIIRGQFSTIPGGSENNINGNYSFAIGRKAINNFNYSFIRNANSTQRSTTDNNQFIIYAANGVGINTNTPGVYALSVSGDVAAKGYYYLSDKRYKENLQIIASPLEKLLAVHGYNFDWKTTKQADMGVIAQEVEKIFPALVATNTDGYKSVKYGNLVAPIIEAIRELNDKIITIISKAIDQQTQIARLEARINTLEQKE